MRILESLYCDVSLHELPDECVLTAPVLDDKLQQLARPNPDAREHIQKKEQEITHVGFSVELACHYQLISRGAIRKFTCHVLVVISNVANSLQN